jgi:hypothetical protein
MGRRGGCTLGADVEIAGPEPAAPRDRRGSRRRPGAGLRDAHLRLRPEPDRGEDRPAPGLRRDPLRGEGELQSGGPGSLPPPGGPGRRGERGGDAPGDAGGLPPERRPAAHRLHRGHLRSGLPRRGSRARRPRQLRLAGHDRPVRRAGAGSGDHAAGEPGLRPRTQSQDQYRRRGIEARDLARGSRGVPAPGRAPLAAHLGDPRPHRLGSGPRAPGPGGGCGRGLRPQRRPGRRDDQRGRRPLRLPPRRRGGRRRRLPPHLGRQPQAPRETSSATRCGSRSSRVATWSPSPATW